MNTTWVVRTFQIHSGDIHVTFYLGRDKYNLQVVSSNVESESKVCNAIAIKCFCYFVIITNYRVKSVHYQIRVYPQLNQTYSLRKRNKANLLRYPEPDPLKNISWHGNLPLLGIQCSLTTPDICFSWIDEAGALEDLPESVEEEEDGNTNIRGEEIGDVPFAVGEDFPSIEEDDDGKVDEGEPGSVWLEWGLEDEPIAIDALSDESGAESQIGDADAAPCEELSDRGQVLKPLEDHVGTGGDGEVG